ncbi:MAG: cytochrome C, partial [Anaerolineae bacterium]|nr:cytochrome C [Anaerolineae bacterium]
MSESVEKIIGPRVPAEEMKVHRGRYLAPTVLFLLAALLLIVSVFLPYWQLTLHAPQYPKGLTVEAYVNRLTGDVHEIDGLNHYIGMRPLDEAAPFEKSVAVLGVVVVALLVLAAVFVHSRWAALLALPALFFSFFFLVDLQYWLANFG